MFGHHKESIENMTAHYRKDPEIKALFLVGSVVTGTARADSDLDGVAIIAAEAFERRKADGKTLETHHGGCTYEGGYFDIHYHTRDDLVTLAKSGSEPMRNLFTGAQVLFCDEPDLPKLAEKIPIFPINEKSEKQLRFYCTLKMYHSYFWVACRPEGFMRFHAADGMVHALYRLILIENEILFPSMRKLEETVMNVQSKPDGVVELCHRFMETLSDQDSADVVKCFETWTSYDYPKKHSVVMNNFADQWEWY